MASPFFSLRSFCHLFAAKITEDRLPKAERLRQKTLCRTVRFQTFIYHYIKSFKELQC